MTKVLSALAIVLVAAGAGFSCAKGPDPEKVPIGTPVQITKQDGGVVSGTLAARDAKTVSVAAGSTTRQVPRDQIGELQLVGDKPAPLPPIAKFREFTIPEGTRLSVRLDSPLGSDSSRVEDPVEGSLTAAVIIDGTEVIPSGSGVRGTVTDAKASGKVSGRGTLSLSFGSVVVSGRDERYPISARINFLAPSGKSKDVKTIGIPAVGGAVLGGIIGGKKGAVTGAAIGAGAGTAVALSTAGPQVRLVRGTVLSLSLDRAVDVRVPVAKQ